ncbi:hypothetical protein HMPREF0973_02578 [Prevotella veroralis F0319]|uniref:Uncharacterized protein n=1 Tax=Prevotella veroralis F0319 TaxID=649761 RepID=C9MSF9_9BACT|nr:hypothetical protein HMPREF0973_02578 [Prevotella veroralis F0319]
MLKPHPASPKGRGAASPPRRVCQNSHTLFFMHKAPTFSSQGFAIS